MKFFNYTLLIQRTWKRSHKSVGSGSENEASLGFSWSDCNILKTLTSWKESKTCFMKGMFIRRLRLRGDWEGVVCNSPFSSSLWPLNYSSEDSFFTALASIWSSIFTNSNEKKTCLLLSIVYIQISNTYLPEFLRWFLIRNWIIVQWDCFGDAVASFTAITRFRRKLTKYMGKPEIPVGKSNGSSPSIWEASENIGCDLRWCSFSSDYF